VGCPGQLADIRSAIQERQAVALASAAHTLKGSCLVIKAQHAADLAFTLERMGRASDWTDIDDLQTRMNSAADSVLQSVDRWRDAAQIAAPGELLAESAAR
jgi:HPt (histidine-containing phosphotransfer) domain-containing protein